MGITPVRSNRSALSFVVEPVVVLSSYEYIRYIRQVCNASFTRNLFGHDIPYKRNKPGKVTEL
jgi:hypothetical protein